MNEITQIRILNRQLEIDNFSEYQPERKPWVSLEYDITILYFIIKGSNIYNKNKTNKNKTTQHEMKQNEMKRNKYTMLRNEMKRSNT